MVETEGKTERTVNLFVFNLDSDGSPELTPVYEVNENLDASCCSILFCKALELRMQECFRENLKRLFPDQKIRGQGKGRGMVALF